MSKESRQTFTYQTRFSVNAMTSKALDDYAFLFNKVSHKLFSQVSAGNLSTQLKNDYLKSFCITARQFNACRVQVDGKISAIKELKVIAIAQLKSKINALGIKIKKLSKNKKNAFNVHQKKRRLHNLQERLKKHQQDYSLGKTRLCFGSKKLFRAQFSLKKNGYENHEQWKKDWEEARQREFFVLGSKDETSGNQSCTAAIATDGTLTLRLRVPNAFVSEYGKYLEIPHVYFDYGHDVISASLNECLERREKKKGFQQLGQAISYRFYKDNKGWRVFATTSLQKPSPVTNKALGAIGVDINVNHLALAQTDRFGNIIDHKTIPLTTYGKSKEQAKAVIGDACAQIIDYAQKAKKPLVLEKLDFEKKKMSLRENKKSHARMLSSFSYQSILQCLKSRAYRYGVEVEEVNPAFTSLIGKVKFAKRYGLSTHHAAAFCIARRSLGFSEYPPSDQKALVPDGRGDYVALSLPVRNRGKHVWFFWRRVHKKFPAALAVHFRTIKNRSLDSLSPILEI